jgi:hypothetical protein
LDEVKMNFCKMFILQMLRAVVGSWCRTKQKARQAPEIGLTGY